MKDRQVKSSGAQASVFIVSPVLHWLAMPALVFLRSGFGYSFLSSKSVFLAFSWASMLFLIYAWMEQGVWRSFWAVALFAASASLLYVIHLITAIKRETQRKGKHDFFSGNSHLGRMPGFAQSPDGRTQSFLRLWIEPAAVLVAAIGLRGFFAERWLSYWLVIVAFALFFKELINYWYGLRSEKKHEDIMEDAQEKMPGGAGFADVPLPNAGGRKSRTKRPPQSATDADDLSAEEQRYAEVLRLMPPRPPYGIEQAEQNFRDLIKTVHPDVNAPTEENNRRSAMLHEAIEFFRSRAGG